MIHQILQLMNLCYCYRHLGGGDSIAVGNAFHQIKNYESEVSLQTKQNRTADLRRMNKAAIVIQVFMSSHHLL